MKQNGPPKKPSSLKVIQGTFRRDRAPRNEPKPEVAIPEVPSHLSDEAKVEWGRVSQELAALGLLTRIDRAALAAYCEAWSDWRIATLEVQKRGMVLKTIANNVVENPYYSVKKRSAELMHKFMTEFGMTPASRTRIEVEPLSSGEAAQDSRWKNF